MDRADALAPRRINAKGFFPPRMLRMSYRIDAYALPQADLVVSAGGETQMPNICVSRFLRHPQHLLRLAAARARRPRISA